MSRKKIFQAAGIIIFATIFSRLVGFVKEVLVASSFGASMENDAFVIALIIPTIVAALAGAALTNAVIPVFTGYLSRGEEDEAWETAITVTFIIILIFSFVALIGFYIAPYLVSVVAPGFSGKVYNLTGELMSILFPMVLFASLSGIVTGILNSYRHFTLPAFSPSIFMAAIILSLILFGKSFGIYSLAFGTVAGSAAQLLIQVPALKGKIKFKFKLNLKSPGVKQFFKAVGPITLGLGITQVSLYLDRLMASGLPSGSISALNYANKIMTIPYGAFATAIAAAFFPVLSHHAAERDMGELKNTFVMAVKAILLITVPAAVGLFVLDTPVVKLLFERGAFDARATAQTAGALQYYVLAIIALGLYDIVVRTFYALDDTVTPVMVGAAVLAFNFFLNLVLRNFLGYGGLAFGTSLAALINVIILIFLLRKKAGPLQGRYILKFALKIAAASSGMGLVCYGVYLGTGKMIAITSFSVSALALQVGLSIIAGVVAYTIFIFLLRINEARQVIRAVSRR